MLESGHYNLFQLAVRIGLEGHPGETLESRDKRGTSFTVQVGTKNKTKKEVTLRPPSMILKPHITIRFFPFSLQLLPVLATTVVSCRTAVLKLFYLRTFILLESSEQREVLYGPDLHSSHPPSHVLNGLMLVFPAQL